MFANATIRVGISQRVVATLVACATVLLSVGAYHVAHAANYEDVSDTLSDSGPSATSGHTITFTPPTGSSIDPGDTITITFPTDTNEFADVDAVVGGDVTVTVDGNGTTTGGFASTDNGATSEITFNNIYAAAGEEVVVAIDAGVITNPSVTGSYQLTVDNGTDIGRLEVAIVDKVTVSAWVDTQFTFTVNGVASSTSINGALTTGTTSATAIPYFELTNGQREVLGHDLDVSTNAINGFSVTVETDGDFRSANGAVIDTFENGNDVSAGGSTWTANPPTADVSDNTTWGHWGITYDDNTLNTGAALGADEYIAASTTPREIFYHNGPAAGTGTATGTTYVAYSVEITGLQEAADDYQTILTYIATPTF